MQGPDDIEGLYEMDAHLEQQYEDANGSIEQDWDDGRWDDDPSPYDGNYSEE